MHIYMYIYIYTYLYPVQCSYTMCMRTSTHAQHDFDKAARFFHCKPLRPSLHKPCEDKMKVQPQDEALSTKKSCMR